MVVAAVDQFNADRQRVAMLSDLTDDHGLTWSSLATARARSEVPCSVDRGTGHHLYVRDLRPRADQALGDPVAQYPDPGRR